MYVEFQIVESATRALTSEIIGQALAMTNFTDILCANIIVINHFSASLSGPTCTCIQPT